MKHRAEISLIPMLASRSESCLARTPSRRDHKKHRDPCSASPAAASGCYGDFCLTQITYPGSLQDLESSQDPWMRQARALCQRQVKVFSTTTINFSLMEPEELVACLQSGDGASSAAVGATPSTPSKETTRVVKAPVLTHKVCCSLVLEARNHPSLCSWLESNGWRINTRNADVVCKAAEHLREDDRCGRGDIASLTDTCLAGLRYRLKEVPVCDRCFSVYCVIHDVVTTIRVKRKDLWAERELQRRQKEEERERQRLKEEEIQKMLTYQRSRKDCVSKGSQEELLEQCPRGWSVFTDSDLDGFIRELSGHSIFETA